MAWTKRQYILAALDEIGLSSYTFDIQPDQLQSALNRLNALMVQWNAQGVRIGYPSPSQQLGDDVDDVCTIPDAAQEAVVLHLAMRLAPSYGRPVMPETKVHAKQAYNAMLTKLLPHYQMQVNPNDIPLGAGYKSIDNSPQFFVVTDNAAKAGEFDSIIDGFEVE